VPHAESLAAAGYGASYMASPQCQGDPHQRIVAAARWGKRDFGPPGSVGMPLTGVPGNAGEECIAADPDLWFGETGIPLIPPNLPRT